MTTPVLGSQASFALRAHNPDVLTCIANLSNDEVFTPPELANQMLDTVAGAWAAAHDGADIWQDPDVTFLDPFTKSGVFLREIVARLTDGLSDQIPDLQERVDHIVTKQVYGIGITLLTSLLARRSVYCSKDATGEHSVAKSFDRSWGNIWFERTEHTWAGEKCAYCGAQKERFLREHELETHAYAFIHTTDPRALLAGMFGANVQFDVIIGNPPYQMTGGAGGTNDSPLYNHFVEQAKKLEPRFLAAVIPSRWMAGGRGLSDFRAAMLSDGRLRVLVDYENAKEIFPTIGIIGGVCYFLWDRDSAGECACTYHRNGVIVGPTSRTMGEFDVFVRDPRALSILRKVRARSEPTLDQLVSGDTPFGLATNYASYTKGEVRPGGIRIYANIGTTRVTGSVSRDIIKKNVALIDAWKLLLPVAGSGRERERNGVDIVTGPSIVAEPGSVCTQTYLTAGPFAGEDETRSVASYLRTRFARFLISLRKPSQHVFRGMYGWVPMQNWDRVWTDGDLYAQYDLDGEEIAFIESQIKPMTLDAKVSVDAEA